MKNENLGERKEKFLFNMNHFDEPEEEEEDILEEELPPPPPVFSEAQLAAAKTQSFQEGKAAGLAEAAQSREQALAQVMNVISKETLRLFAQEHEREKAYEVESVKLTLSIFKQLFPVLNAHHGFEELRDALEKTLIAHGGKHTLQIRVAESLTHGVDTLMGEVAQQHESLSYSVTGDANIAENDCKLTWDDGGFVRDAAVMTHEIEQILQEMLAGEGVKGHDNKEQLVDVIKPETPPESSEPGAPAPEDASSEIMEKPDE